MKAERRVAPRKEVCHLTISHISVTESMAKLAKVGYVLNASAKGFLVQIRRQDLIPKLLKHSLSLDVLVGESVVIKIEEMNLELFGKISRTRLLGKAGFEIAIDYSSEAPQYWRDCLMDLLPTPDEFHDFESGWDLINGPNQDQFINKDKNNEHDKIKSTHNQHNENPQQQAHHQQPSKPHRRHLVAIKGLKGR